MVTNTTKKAELRKWAKNLRQSLDLKKISSNIETKIVGLDTYRSAKTVMSYLAKDIEIVLNSLFRDKSKSWFLPITLEVKNQGAEILVVPYIPGTTKLVKGKFDILEPEVINDNYFDQLDKTVKLDLIFVPGLCFDKEGNRIGFGVGFYDRFLRKNSNSFKIGCCPKECFIDKVPSESWDIKVDLVLTD